MHNLPPFLLSLSKLGLFSRILVLIGRRVQSAIPIGGQVLQRVRIWPKADFFEGIRFAVEELRRNHHRAFLRILEKYPVIATFAIFYFF